MPERGVAHGKVHLGVRLSRAVIFALGVSIAAPAGAQADNRDGELPVELHGFVSQGFIKTTDNNYLAASERGSFEFTEAGINVTKQLTDRLRVGVQLFARDLGPLGNYAAQFDWFYLDYRFWDWLGIRAGRTKLPFGLYNETSDIDAARVPILLPQSIYPIQNRDFLLAQTGLELYGIVPLGDAGGLDYRLYGGTLFFDPADSDAGTLNDISVPYLIGGRLMWLTPLEGLQVGGSAQALRLDFDLTPPPETIAQLEMSGALPANFTGRVTGKIPAVLWVASAEYLAGELLVAAEYSRWHVKLETSLPVLFPETETTSERAYVMASYRVMPWLTPGLYYSLYFPDVDNRRGSAGYQHDVAATLRFDINDHWLAKAEGHFMRGTAALDSDLNGGAELDVLTRDWGLLLLKTTAYF